MHFARTLDKDTSDRDDCRRCHVRLGDSPESVGVRVRIDASRPDDPITSIFMWMSALILYAIKILDVGVYHQI